MEWRRGAGRWLMMVALAVPGISACGVAQSAPPEAVWTPRIRQTLSMVSALPSAYAASTKTSDFSVGLKKPWMITKASPQGAVLQRYWVPSRTRPKIVYAMPDALALEVTRRDVGEILLNTSSGQEVGLWRLPLSSSLYPITEGGFGGQTFFWKITAGSDGPIAGFGAYNLATRRPVRLKVAQIRGAWYDDLSEGDLLRVRGNLLSEWRNGKWTLPRKLSQGVVDVISQRGWVMSVLAPKPGRVKLRWYNARVNRGAAMTGQGTLEASGADWALLLQGENLSLDVPSLHRQTLVAQRVVNPITANNCVYWRANNGRAHRLCVSTNVLSAVPDIAWP